MLAYPSTSAGQQPLAAERHRSLHNSPKQPAFHGAAVPRHPRCFVTGLWLYITGSVTSLWLFSLTAVPGPGAKETPSSPCTPVLGFSHDGAAVW